MKRIDFVKNCLALGVGMPFMSFLVSSCKKDEVLYPAFDVNFTGKVLVIGSGSAGMTAGYLLKRYNIDFEILEASSTYGGRVKGTDDLADFPIDLGAEWIHEDPSVLARLLSDVSITDNIDVITYNPQTVYNWNKDKLRKQNWASNFYSEYKFKSQGWFNYFDKYMIPHIHDKIKFDHAVQEIDCSGAKTIVKTNQGDFEADRVIVTVPAKIIQNQSINFIPAFPNSKTQAFNSIVMPEGIKAFIKFSKKFYPDLLLMGSLLGQAAAQEHLFYDAAFRKETQDNVLGLFAVGNSAKYYTDLGSDDKIFDQILSDLDKIFEGKASRYYQKHIIQNWTDEPYIQGSYVTIFNQNESDTIQTLKAPLNNKVYFAGEVYSENNGATVPGAAETAYDVVREILSSN